MSATAPAAAATTRRGPRRSTLLVLGALLLAVTVVALGTTSTARSAALDPDNPSPGGGQALARVLADEGVDVEVVRDADALEDAEVDAGTTVVVTSTQLLGEGTTARLLDHAADGRVLVTGPGVGVLDALGVEEPATPAEVDAPLEADCDDEVDGPNLAGLSVEVDTADAYALPGCFATDQGAVLAEVSDGVTVLGAPELLANEAVLRADNAAVALRLLGAGDRLVWYVPDAADLSAGEGRSLSSLLPDWLVPSLWLLLAASLVGIAWRARRFGPLATEPLPVSVRATETTRSRGRLYHRARDRGHAAAALRRAARDRVAARLGAPSTAPAPGAPDPLVGEVARRTGRHPGEVEWLLSPHAEAPGSDDDLITLADRLAELDREVRRT